jgi:putative ABC transport system permease protein
MTVGTILHTAVKALGRNRLRTLLTMLGLIIGVGAVISMMALGAGARNQIEEQIKAAGTNMIVVSAGNWTQGGVRLGMGSSSKLTAADADAIRRQVPGVLYLAGDVHTHQQIIANGQNWATTVEGTDVDLPMIRHWDLERGAFFGPDDVTADKKVAVLGSSVRDMIFGTGVNPVGQTVRIGIEPFKIVGVLQSKGQSAVGQDQDDIVYVPYTTAQKKLMGVTYLTTITVSARSADQIAAVTAQLTSVLRNKHKIMPGDPDDFRVSSLEEIASVRSATTDTMTTLLGAIAAVSLLVGGIGIMNIMLVSVTERTREIGLRVAIGAKGSDVRLQFLLEAVLMSLAGGAVGVGLGLGLSRLLTVFLAWPTDLTLDPVILSFGCAAAIGIFFGWYPARKASRLDPIDALRFE